MALVTKHFNCGYGRKPEVKYRGNCLNSTILVTNLETRTLECFSPSLMLIWVLKSSQYSKRPKYAWLIIGEGEGYIWERTKVWRLNLRNFRENSRKTVSVSTICDEYCRIYLNLLWMTLLAGRQKTLKWNKGVSHLLMIDFWNFLIWISLVKDKFEEFPKTIET